MIEYQLRCRAKSMICRQLGYIIGQNSSENLSRCCDIAPNNRKWLKVIVQTDNIARASHKSDEHVELLVIVATMTMTNTITMKTTIAEAPIPVLSNKLTRRSRKVSCPMFWLFIWRSLERSCCLIKFNAWQRKADCCWGFLIAEAHSADQRQIARVRRASHTAQTLDQSVNRACAVELSPGRPIYCQQLNAIERLLFKHWIAVYDGVSLPEVFDGFVSKKENEYSEIKTKVSNQEFFQPTQDRWLVRVWTWCIRKLGPNFKFPGQLLSR